MSQQIEPTYLRYIYDGLAKGVIHPDNASALPDGLIGLYEEAFSENLSAVERQKLLEQFTIWALLKKEVSANFVAEVLGEKEEDILNFIGNYSKWFNSPASGKYQLYHERLRVYFLQKIENIIDTDTKLLEKLLRQNERTSILKSECTNYLQIFYGDHLFISAHYNTNNDKYYRLLCDYNSAIKQNEWIVKDRDLMRWNSNLAILASIEIDVPTLKNIFLYQDDILNKKIDLDNLLKNVLHGDLNELNDILLFKSDETEKYLIVLSLVIRIIDLIDKIENENIPFDKKLVNTAINYLLKKLNGFNVNKDWLICNELIEELNFRLAISSLTVGVINEELSNLNSKKNVFDGNIPSVYNIGGYFDGFDFNEFANEIIEEHVSVDDLNEQIKYSLMKLINEVIEPNYHGDLMDLKEIEVEINQYSIINEIYGLKLKEIIHKIKNALGLTGCSDLNIDYNIEIEFIVYQLLKFDLKFVKTNWISCFCNSIEYIDYLNYYYVIASSIHSDNWGNQIIFEKSWKTKKHMLHTSLSVATILCEKSQSSTAINLYKETIDYYINYNYSNNKNFEFIKYIKLKKLSKNELKDITSKLETLEYLHMSTLSAILCQQMDFLNLVKTLNYDDIYLSSVPDNKAWSYEILKGIIMRIGKEETELYLLEGFDKYVKVMGNYGFKEYDRESNRPKENVWKIEWWVMANFISVFCELVDELNSNFISKQTHNEDKNNTSSFSKNKYYRKIECIFIKYNYSPKENLYASIEEYKDQNFLKTKYKDEERSSLKENNIVLNYKLNQKNTLLNYISRQNDKTFINNLANAIRLDI